MFKHQIEGMMWCLAVGDALGIPFECKTYSEILKMRENAEEKLENPYRKCCGHPFIPDDFEPGMYTDDTQLSLAMFRALERYGHKLSDQVEFEKSLMPLIVEEHVKEFEKSIVGWGGTRDAIKRLQQKTHSYKDSGNVGAVGNGVIMKLAPLFLFYFRELKLDELTREEAIEKIENISNEWLNDQVTVITKMTHDTQSCIVTSCLMIRFGMLILLYGKEFINFKKEIFSNLLKYCKELEINDIAKSITTRIQTLIDNLDDLKDDLTLVNITNGGTFESVNSLMMVIGIVMSLQPNQKPFELIERAAYIGGDCDSNASMVGGLIGSVFGKQIIPDSYIKHLVFDFEICE
ncbi:ADP-ribosylation/crystallin [Naegleria gruberi]|uniref:ADP-ribosylhydrolase ARH3 n=1 Tax=Naegleria gruberi TaxID=5762 RepID=D2V6W0_NAEGR|nr:ADP-ribosylation/crystallin [Naegleria gruberi]EFC47515.1 ADP-ribosylation/crystallin [Naegleria gruberi]|eukprot:XP_002680259.1 ADP-ribosylation/crystallin [Naegleria gruberi strain NEG-M]